MPILAAYRCMLPVLLTGRPHGSTGWAPTCLTRASSTSTPRLTTTCSIGMHPRYASYCILLESLRVISVPIGMPVTHNRVPFFLCGFISAPVLTEGRWRHRKPLARHTAVTRGPSVWRRYFPAQNGDKSAPLLIWLQASCSERMLTTTHTLT